MLKQLIKNAIFGYKSSQGRYINHLRRIGVQIGDDVTIYAPTKTFIDEQYPWMLTIGSHVRITEGVKILTHDYSWSVLKLADTPDKGIVLGASGKVCIGNNVFIGMNAIITRNVTIGNNVIIGAGSIVTKDCKENSVYAGNPAKYIMSVDEYLNKRKELQVAEAKQLVKSYYERFRKYPDEKALSEYFMLFSDGENLVEPFREKLNLCENPHDSLEFMKRQERRFPNYDSFIQECLKD